LNIQLKKKVVCLWS